MKHFIIAVTLLAIIVAGVCVNGYYVRKTVGKALDLTESLPETQVEFDSYSGDIQDFVNKWYSWHGFLSYSLHMCELERACEAVADIKACFESGSFDNYLQAKRRLETVLGELADGEKPSFVHIF